MRNINVLEYARLQRLWIEEYDVRNGDEFVVLTVPPGWPTGGGSGPGIQPGMVVTIDDTFYSHDQDGMSVTHGDAETVYGIPFFCLSRVK